MVVHRHALRGTLARLCRLIMHPRPGRDIVLPGELDGVRAQSAPSSAIARPGGNGQIVDIEIEDTDEDETSELDDGVHPHPSHNA